MDSRISRTVQFIDGNYSGRISANDLREYAKLSRSRLDALFRRHTGVSPAKYLKEIRIEKAAQLLRGDELLSIKEVMAQVGFVDKSSFTRSFKRAFGVAPSEYRQSVGADSIGKTAEAADSNLIRHESS